jgi:hypothetical protein
MCTLRNPFPNPPLKGRGPEGVRTMIPSHDHEAQLAGIVAYLRAELGYDGDGPGSLRRQIQENTQMIRNFDDALRGRGDELGIAGWLMVIRRTWVSLVALLGGALGYVLNDVVEALGHTM